MKSKFCHLRPPSTRAVIQVQKIYCLREEEKKNKIIFNHKSCERGLE